MKLSRQTRNNFASQSSGPRYYETKGEAVATFNEVLEAFGLLPDPATTSQMHGDEGRVTPRLVDLETETKDEGLASLSWFRMPSGRYEVVGYLA